MRRKMTQPTCLVLACVATALAVSSPPASAGEFRITTCQSDRLGFSADAFNDFAARGMLVKRACSPEGPGLRGVITTNAVSRGRVARGSMSYVTLNAPVGTRFTKFRWAGSLRRLDCTYAIGLYADGPKINAIRLKHLPANAECPQQPTGQAAGYKTTNYDVTGATRISQLVVCAGGGGQKSCSAGTANYIRTYKAEVGVEDVLGPTAGVLGDTPLGRGDWVGGTQALGYEANDNVGVRSAQAMAAGQTGGAQQRPCSLGSQEGAYTKPVPCPNGPGRIDVDTKRFPEGTQQLSVQVQDTAGNLGSSPPVAARIDNTPPSRVDVAVEGGDQWRNQNDFAVAWANPAEPDRAPIAGASYKVCPAGGETCTPGEQTGADLARLGVQVPGPGDWRLSLWRGDAAGNKTETAESVPVALRYDPEPPGVAFEPMSASDPTLISVLVNEKVSGIADGAIEISREGSGSWAAMQTRRDGIKLLATVDDYALPAGRYLLRARAVDHARNETSTDRRTDGQVMALTLPLRIASMMRAGVLRSRMVRRSVRRRGKRVTVRRRVPVLRPGARVAYGQRVQIRGVLANPDGQGLSGADVKVYSRSPVEAERLVGIVKTDSRGRYRYTATGTTSRTLRVVFEGSSLVVPSQTEIPLVVPAASSLEVSRSRVLNGQAVRFSGRVRTAPRPPAGKLVELQVQLSGNWQTFRTTRTGRGGRWAIPYRFKRTRGIQRFRFRVKLPGEAGYPFASGASRSLGVRVRGR